VFEGFPEGKDFEEFEQPEFVEGKSLLHPHLPNTTCISITLFIYLLLCTYMMGPMSYVIKVRLVLFTPVSCST
jgi:hypothetical protein